MTDAGSSGVPRVLLIRDLAPAMRERDFGRVVGDEIGGRGD
jgi:hypothetical protein